MSLGTTIVVLDRGRLIQLGAPGDIYHRPTTRFVAEFIGRPAMNTIPGEISGGVFRAGELAVRRGPQSGRADGPVVLGIRPEDIGVEDAAGPDAAGPDAAGPDAAVVEMTLDVIEAIEPDTLLVLVRGGVSLTARVLRRSANLRPGEAVRVSLPRAALRFFDPEDGRRL
jgi:ABC-type sugar transport system ATPase subunit